jgi:hypothetical protein
MQPVPYSDALPPGDPEQLHPPQRWSFAMAVQQKSSPLRQALNTAIRELIAEGIVAEIFAQYGVSYVPPCSSAPIESSCAGVSTAGRGGDSGAGRRCPMFLKSAGQGGHIDDRRSGAEVIA